ncbi:hypothetical protein BTVI_145509 [Pitangus sulphuratus]|nr:hypothetical protein BTVI_145509 [Pitangus sulphuratus]
MEKEVAIEITEKLVFSQNSEFIGIDDSGHMIQIKLRPARSLSLENCPLIPIYFDKLRQSVCLSEKLYSVADLQSNIERLSEEMKDGLKHLAETLRLYLKTEIQDESQLPPAIDFFQIFTKACEVDIKVKKRYQFDAVC